MKQKAIILFHGFFSAAKVIPKGLSYSRASEFGDLCDSEPYL